LGLVVRRICVHASHVLRKGPGQGHTRTAARRANWRGVGTGVFVCTLPMFCAKAQDIHAPRTTLRWSFSRVPLRKCRGEYHPLAFPPVAVTREICALMKMANDIVGSICIRSQNWHFTIILCINMLNCFLYNKHMLTNCSTSIIVLLFL